MRREGRGVRRVLGNGKRVRMMKVVRMLGREMGREERGEARGRIHGSNRRRRRRVNRSGEEERQAGYGAGEQARRAR